MADQKQQISSRPWILEAVPLLVVILIGAHVLALISYRGETSSKTKGALAGRDPVFLLYKKSIPGYKYAFHPLLRLRFERTRLIVTC